MEYKTKIENIDYLDMGDSKNSWYLDATRFDPNFPLAMTYITPDFVPLKKYVEEKKPTNVGAYLEEKGLVMKTHILAEKNYVLTLNGEWHSKVYSVLNSSVEFYRENKNLSMIFIEGSIPNPFIYGPDVVDSIYSRLPDSWVIEQYLAWYCAFIPNIHFMARNWNKINGVFYGTLLICSEMEPEKLFERYSKSKGYYESDGIFTSQLIVTKDWDLVKRYLFFMIRNHQYENFQADYSHSLDDYLLKNFPVDTSDFDPLCSTSINLPYDVRNGNFDLVGDSIFQRFRFYDRKEWRKELDKQGFKK